ncbi:hypothetical protein ASE04_18850 [Rhizobium sp. Root708]|nr:hypothetical protein ASE04_18850 [Rhizobium sp. Root708]
MTEHVEPAVAKEASIRVWGVRDFCKRNHVEKAEEVRLLKLFRRFATPAELIHNVSRKPRWR